MISKVISRYILRIFGSKELCSKSHPRVFINFDRSIVGELVESAAGLVFWDVPKLLESDELISVDLTVTVLVRVGEGGLEESLQMLWNGSGGGNLSSDTSSPVGELAAVDFAIVINISVIHQKLEDLLLVADGLIVEVISWSDAGGPGQLVDDGFVVVEVDDAITVHVVSELEQKFKFLSKEITHLCCL